MYIDGLEIAGVGVGMVFLALVVILIVTLILRAVIDRAPWWRQKRSSPAATPLPEGPAPAIGAPEAEAPAIGPEPVRPAPDRTARAAAIAVALFLAEEEADSGGG